MDYSSFIKQKSSYEDLLCYKKSLCVYDVTYYFAHKYLQKGDILIKQTDYLLKRYFDRIKQDFLENGGIREEMTRGRLQWRKENGLG
jgi:four helix bundle suffix protein